jgi:hypothetical protein
MGLRDALRALKREARGQVESFELEDGSRFYYDANEAAKELYLHFFECGCADSVAERPEPPEVLRAVLRARDRRSAVEQLYAPQRYFDIMPYDLDALRERGELVHRSMVAGQELGEELEDLSE